MRKELQEIHTLVRSLVRLKKSLIGTLPHHGESALFLHNDRLTTGLMNNVSEIALSLLNSKLMIQHNGLVTYVDAHQDNFLQKANDELQHFGLPTLSKDVCSISKRSIESYLLFAHKAQRSLAFFRSELTGKITPIYLWGHGFDFSVEWRSERKGTYIITGIAPFDEFDDHPYAYITPQPFETYFTKTSPPIGEWHTNGWQGIKIPWSDLEKLSMHSIAAHFTDLFKMLQTALDDRACRLGHISKSEHLPST